jgi:3-oxoacyl-(acyl-carrier-protein) synthase
MVIRFYKYIGIILAKLENAKAYCTVWQTHKFRFSLFHGYYCYQCHGWKRGDIVMKKRIVVTGLGIVSPLGVGVNENWNRYFSGMSGIKEFEIDGNGSGAYAGKVSDDELDHFIPEDKKGKIDRFSSFALVAAKMAFGDAQIGNDFDREKIGVFIGSTYSGLNIIEKQIKMLYAEGPRKVHPLLMQNSLTNAPSGEVAIALDLKGPNIGFSCGACSSEYSIIQAFNVLQQRDIDAMVAGGTEAPLLPGFLKN